MPHSASRATGYPDRVIPVFILSAGLILAGLVQIFVMIRASDGRLGRNRFAGIRTRMTLSSDEAWMTAHQAARSLGLRSGIAFLAGGMVLPLARVGRLVGILGVVLGIVYLYLSTRAGVRSVTPVASRTTK